MRLILRFTGLPQADDLWKLFLGGLIGLMLWELFARFLTPIFVGGPLEPAALIISLLQNLFGVTIPRLPAEAIHYTTGIVFYPIGYWILSRYILTLGTTGDGILWGFVTWILALGVFASLAGLPFMLGFIPLTWFSLIGHVLYAFTAVTVASRLGARAPAVARAA